MAASRRRLRPGRTAWVAALGLYLAGCSMAPAPVDVAPVERLPQAYTEAETVAGPSALRWWTVFQDPVLERLVDDVAEANLDLREAVARVEEVRAQYRVARSGLLPSVQASLDFSRFDQPANTGQFGAIFGGSGEGEDPDAPGDVQTPDRFSFETFGASLGFSYELDIWGRLRAGRGAAIADLVATEADVLAVRMGVIAETVSAYFETLELERRGGILRDQVDLLAERLSLTEERYERGVVTSLELYQIRQDYNGTRAQLPLLEGQLTDARGRLAVLLGRYPHELDALLDPESAPMVSTEPVPAGLPSTLLVDRPDVLSAGLRLEAARLRVGERRAARFPSLSLTGSAGQQSSELSDVLRADQWFTNFVTSLTAPLFTGGRLAAEEAAARARYEQEAARYARTVLTAFKEVATALAVFDAQRARQAVLQEQAEAAEASVANQRRRLDLGIGDYVAYLDALRQSLNIANTRATAERELALSRLNVHRALGGSWLEAEEGS